MDLILIFTIVVLLSTTVAWVSLAPWVPTKYRDLKKINEIINLKPKQKFLEIGCGDAKVCSYIARKNPNSEIIGIEMAPIFYLYSKIRSCIFGPKNLKIIFGDALKQDISNIDIFYTFLLKDTLNNQVRNKLNKEMKKGSKIVSYICSMKNWKGKYEQYKTEGEKPRLIHVYWN